MPRRDCIPSVLAVVAALLLALGSLAWGGLVSGTAWANVAASGPRLVVIRDAETETLLRNFATPLFRAAGLDPNLVRIIVIRDDAINSFVSTGNRMFIHTGLIEKAASASQLVGVIAHETGHIYGGHLAKLPVEMRQAMLQSVAALLIGAAAGVAAHDPAPAMGAVLGGTQMAQRNLLSFSRGMEASADQAAMTFLDANGWSARGLLDLFHTLEDQQLLASSEQDPYVLTHPLTRDRIAFVQKHVETSRFSDAPLPAGWEAEFQMVRAKLRGFLTPSSVTLARVPDTDASAPARYERSVALYRLGHTDDATRLLDGLIAEQKGDPWLQEMKGQVLFEGGRVHDAILPYQEAARMAPEQPLIRQGLGRAMIESNDPLLLRPAVQQLQAALRSDRDDNFSWHELGVAWGRLGEMGQANLALAEDALLQGDIRSAHLFADKAEQALPAGPSRLRAQDISNAVKKENRLDDEQ
jgi:predicted Zn-dependent protease